MTSTSIDALTDLLEQERAALLSGDIDKLARLAPHKERVLQSLDATDRPALDALHGKALRNQELIDSALQGIRDVTDRLQAMRAARRSLETYDSHGHRRSIEATVRPTVEKRA